ncbi:MAG TPA: Fic family protein [Gaiellaceae bacterium]|nr:Fic family protein [Gaiellaceae bacterium]
MIAYLELADYLLIAESVLGLPAEAIANFNRIGLAQSALGAPQAGFGGVEAYPDFETKAAVLCWHLVKNHPLPDGNKRCAFLATVEFVERNGRAWVPATGDPDETDHMIRGVAGGDVSEAYFREWIAQRCGEGPKTP